MASGFRHTGTPWPVGRGGDGEMRTRDNGSADSVGGVELRLRYKDSELHFQKRQRFESQDRDYGSPDPMLSLGLGLGLQGPFYEEQRGDRREPGLHEGTGWGVGGDGEREEAKEGGPETKPLAVW